MAAIHVIAAVAATLEMFTNQTCLRWGDMSAAGILLWVSLLGIVALGTVRLVLQLVELPAGLVTVLLWIVVLLGVFRTIPALVQQYGGWERVIRRQWRTTGAPRTDWTPRADAPFVTIQVPIHAEPPEIVIPTLEYLNALDYPAYEVLVIDNNTADPGLWRPVADHCALLGTRFRFLHVEGITGAKAGALNWARPRLDPRTQLVALVDADYQVQPQWLRHTVGLFDDHELGFVQGPHAYRDFAHSRYQRMANAAYAWAQASEMVSRDEHGAGITVGTMSLIRLAALDEAGGWAEWCMTEDSEFAIRVHAAGWTSTFIRHVYGRGLIPETFAELKKQRYRWTYGPGQEFKRHWRFFLPGPWHQPSQLTKAQRWRHGNYDLVILTTGAGVLLLPVSGGLLVAMAISSNVPVVMPSVLAGIIATLVVRRLMRWTIYRTVVGLDTRTTVGGLVALLAVRPTVSGAGFDVLLGRRTSFQRTDKFRQQPNIRRAFNSARTEIVLALSCLTSAVLTLALLPHVGGTYLLALSFVWLTYVHRTGPFLAYQAEADLRRPDTPPTHAMARAPSAPMRRSELPR
jgi:cellulose synthase/poly-beta-1,6-N-acetylglucosamine synthase-like glycosyltransferase